jgi:hypothetical protein
MTETPVERRASERARYLAATTDLADREAEAVAYSELGYSHAGIAKHVDSTESTVGDLTPVTTEDIADWSDHRRRMWREAAEQHPEYVPDDVGAPEVTP